MENLEGVPKLPYFQCVLPKITKFLEMYEHSMYKILYIFRNAAEFLLRAPIFIIQNFYLFVTNYFIFRQIGNVNRFLSKIQWYFQNSAVSRFLVSWKIESYQFLYVIVRLNFSIIACLLAHGPILTKRY